MYPSPEYKVIHSHLRSTLIAIKQVLGETKYHEILNKARLGQYASTLPPDDSQEAIPASEYAHLLEEIELAYPRSGKHVLNLIGQTLFQQIIREQSLRMKLAQYAFGRWNQQKRIQNILECIAESVRKSYPFQEIWVGEKGDTFALNYKTCLDCYQRQSITTICYLTQGYIQEAVQWTTGRNDITVNEIDCRAKGDPFCRFEVKVTPARKSTT